MKYIITDFGEVVIGSPSALHTDLAKGASGTVVSAGHMRINEKEIIVFGESFGFDMKAKPEDAKIIEQALRREPVEEKQEDLIDDL